MKREYHWKDWKNPEYRKDDIERARMLSLKRNYSISIEEYNELFTKQGGVCAICGRESKKSLGVDHEHKTGKVRGLLCSNCNTAIGQLNDDPKLLLKAIAYLTK